MVILSYISYCLQVFYCTQKYISWIKKTTSPSCLKSSLEKKQCCSVQCHAGTSPVAVVRAITPISLLFFFCSMPLAQVALFYVAIGVTFSKL